MCIRDSNKGIKVGLEIHGDVLKNGEAAKKIMETINHPAAFYIGNYSLSISNTGLGMKMCIRDSSYSC